MNNCQQCGKTFPPKVHGGSAKKFCDHKCREAFSRRKTGVTRPPVEERPCAHCKKKFPIRTVMSRKQKYCTESCRCKAKWLIKKARQKAGLEARGTGLTSRDSYGFPTAPTPKVSREDVQKLYDLHYNLRMTPREAWLAVSGKDWAPATAAELWLLHPDVFDPYPDPVIGQRFALGDLSVLKSCTVWERDDLLVQWVDHRPERWSSGQGKGGGRPSAGHVNTRHSELDFIKYMTNKSVRVAA